MMKLKMSEFKMMMFRNGNKNDGKLLRGTSHVLATRARGSTIEF